MNQLFQHPTTWASKSQKRSTVSFKYPNMLHNVSNKRASHRKPTSKKTNIGSLYILRKWSGISPFLSRQVRHGATLYCRVALKRGWDRWSVKPSRRFFNHPVVGGLSPRFYLITDSWHHFTVRHHDVRHRDVHIGSLSSGSMLTCNIIHMVSTIQ